MLKVNGVQVGGTVDDLKEHFNNVNFCTKINEGEKSFILRYSYQSLSFKISPHGIMREIELYSPL
ncbi:hypothetical protein [Psychroflexus sp. MES1-P1E]|uniref:hypothetical protein n=1 Tax=Psychroflexus sp. MES1-P1E TaxID=2058320 RepID=UPI000C7A2BCB|nr:hypothetical protein [Psychroflexus sp. MES1-P1E]PKG41195.1 hypothetical protein CXF67_16535 [Psychroflexus sp. MES1-P1E]